MNKKLIAAAVSAAVVAPVAAYGEVTLYGRIANAIELNDLDDSAGASGKTDISTVSSRFGIKYSQGMGNGLTAHGQYEFSTTTDKEKANNDDPKDDDEAKHGTSGGIEDVRVATVGLSGAFGRIDVGNQWSSYFNTFGSLVSPTYSLGYYIYSSIGGGAIRASNTIKYSNSFGPVSLQLDVRFNESGEIGKSGGNAEKLAGDGVGLGLRFAVIDGLTVAVASDSEDGPEGAGTDPDGPDADRLGISAKYTWGDYWVSVGLQSYEVDADERNGDPEVDVDSTIIYGGGNFSETTNWLVGVAEANNGDDNPGVDDAEQTIWGIYHNLGGGLKLYYEGTAFEDGKTNSVDGTRQYLGMRVDF